MEAATPLFDAFLTRILPDPEVRHDVLEYLRYTLLPSRGLQIAQAWVGSRATGKSTLAAIACAMHTETFCDVAGTELFQPFHVAQLENVSLAVLDGGSVREFNKIANDLKAAIAGEPFSARRKGQPEIKSIAPIARWVLIPEEPEEVRQGRKTETLFANSAGLLRRLQVIRFEQPIHREEMDYNLAQKIIEQELPAIRAKLA